MGYGKLYERLVQLNAFVSRKRPPTPAILADRLYNLSGGLRRQVAATIAFHTVWAECIGRSFEILFDKPGRYPGQIVGRSPYLQPVQVMAPPTMIGDVAAVKITQRSTNSLFGALVKAPMGAEPMLTEG